MSVWLSVAKTRNIGHNFSAIIYGNFILITRHGFSISDDTKANDTVTWFVNCDIFNSYFFFLDLVTTRALLFHKHILFCSSVLSAWKLELVAYVTFCPVEFTVTHGNFFRF